MYDIMPVDGFIITLINCYETYDILYVKQKPSL